MAQIISRLHYNTLTTYYWHILRLNGLALFVNITADMLTVCYFDQWPICNDGEEFTTKYSRLTSGTFFLACLCSRGLRTEKATRLASHQRLTSRSDGIALIWRHCQTTYSTNEVTPRADRYEQEPGHWLCRTGVDGDCQNAWLFWRTVFELLLRPTARHYLYRPQQFPSGSSTFFNCFGVSNSGY